MTAIDTAVSQILCKHQIMVSHALDAENCAILSVSQQSESLENYFVSLVGGESHA